jgi:DNA-binding GntR family transcriptional regulator
MAQLKTAIANRTNRVSLCQNVENYIREAIYKGHLHPRERIIEDNLARGLNVSRGTVREALLRLAGDGLIVISPRRGTYIRDISRDEIRVIFGIRGKLEGLCVRYMREANRPETGPTLRGILRKMKSAAASKDDERFFYADMELHHTVWRLSGQPLLVRTLNSVMNPFIFMIARIYSSGEPIAVRYEGHKNYVHTILQTPISRVEREVERYFHNLYRHFNGLSPPYARLPLPMEIQGPQPPWSAMSFPDSQE